MTLDTQLTRQVQLLIVDPQGRLLLKRDESIARWLLLGGELAHDEDYPATAIRLLFAEVGLTCPLGPLLRQREPIDAAGQPGEERFFLVRCPDVQHAAQACAQTELLLADSRGTTPCYEWWPLAEMQQADDDAFSPSWLPELLASVLFSERMMPTSTARF